MYANIYSLPGILAAIIIFIIGIYAFRKDPKNKLNQVFLIFAFFVMTFALGESIIRASSNVNEGLLAGRIAYLGIIFNPILLSQISYNLV